MRRVLGPIMLLISLLSIAFSTPMAMRRVVAAPPVQAALAVITSPQSLTTVRGNVVIMGSATHPNFWKYEIHYGVEPNPVDWIPIGQVHETPVVNGRLETWDTTLVPDGTYSLRLRVARRDGNYDEYYVRQLTVANQVPTETPTPAVTATPTVTPTPLPPTPTIVIEQPKRETPTPPATPTLQPAVEEATPTPGNTLNISTQALLDSFCNGSKVALAVFVAVGVLALVRKIIAALFRWILRRFKKEEDLED